MKSKLLIIILVLIMIVPTVAAIFNYISLQSGAVSAINVVSMTLKDPDGNSYSFARERGGESEKMLDFFIRLNGNSEEIGTLPSTVSSEVYWQATISTTAKDTAYKYYLTSSPEDCYFMDGEGKLKQISDKDAAAFLETRYAAYLYENGLQPALTVSSVSVLPSSSVWKFKCTGNMFIEAPAQTTDHVEAYKLEGGLALSFNLAPDLLSVKVTDNANSEVLFDDLYENIAGLNISENMSVNVTVTAKWYEDATRTYYGEQTYCFDASLSAPAHFYAGVNTVQIGEFVCITATNVNNPDKIEFSSSPDIAYTPKFYADGDYSYALIPFTRDCAAGTYSLSFAYGGASQNVNITLTARDNPFRTKDITYTEAIYNSYYSDEVINKANEVLGGVAAGASSTHMFSGSFVGGCEGGIISTGFGHTVNIAGKGKSYINNGVDYTAAAGTAVQAVNAGEVIYSGYLDYTGYTVVIEHGYGLKSWYFHMSSVSVEVGAKVKTGDKVGECGASGFAADNGVHVELTIFDTPVCQYTLWSDGINKGIPVYKPEN